MAASHGYRLFGLNVLSELEIPHWPAGGPPWDVRIVHGKVPRELPGAPVLWRGALQAERGRCLLRYPASGCVLVENGSRVTVADVPEGGLASLAHLLGATGFAALLYQRGALCLHASALAWKGRAYLIMGPSGAGKSTTASALLARGGEFMADDVTAIMQGPEGEFVATPSFPSVRLRPDSHRELGHRIAAHGAVDPVDDKVRLRYTGAAAAEPRPIARICFLENDAALLRPFSAPLRGQESVSALQRSMFRRRLGRIVADPARLAETAIALAQRVDVVRLSRPQRMLAVDEVCELVIA